MRVWALFIFCVLSLAACSQRKAKVPKIFSPGARESGLASWYGEPYHGRKAANGETYDMEQLTAAHRTMPFETRVRVMNLKNDKQVVVRITDRGPFVEGRIIDLSRAAAREIDMLRDGVVEVRLEVVEAPDLLSRDSKPVAQGASNGQLNKEAHKETVDGFLLQAGAFRDEANAREMAARIESIGLAGASSPKPEVRFDESRGLWRVRLGVFAGMGEAQEAASTLRREGVESFVVALDR